MSQLDIWGFDENQVGGKVGKSHPETSQKASKNVRSGTQQAQILSHLLKINSGTAYEISEHVFNTAGRSISPNQCATRLLELREKGLLDYVRDSRSGQPIERETTPGNTGLVQRLSKRGMEQAVRIGINQGVTHGERKTVESKRLRSDTESFT